MIYYVPVYWYNFTYALWEAYDIMSDVVWHLQDVNVLRNHLGMSLTTFPALFVHLRPFPGGFSRVFKATSPHPPFLLHHTEVHCLKSRTQHGMIIQRMIIQAKSMVNEHQHVEMTNCGSEHCAKMSTISCTVVIPPSTSINKPRQRISSDQHALNILKHETRKKKTTFFIGSFVFLICWPLGIKWYWNVLNTLKTGPPRGASTSSPLTAATSVLPCGAVHQSWAMRTSFCECYHVWLVLGCIGMYWVVIPTVQQLPGIAGYCLLLSPAFGLEVGSLQKLRPLHTSRRDANCDRQLSVFDRGAAELQSAGATWRKKPRLVIPAPFSPQETDVKLWRWKT